VIAAIPIAAARITGLGLGAMTEPGVAEEVLQDGVGLSTGIVLLGLAALLVGRGHRRLLTVAGAVAATAGFAFSGHTTTAHPRWLVTVSDAAHAFAGAVWLGGLIALVAVLRARRGDAAATAGPVVGRFSSLAAVALLAVAVCGLLVGWREVRTLDALTSTTYGKLLLAKVAIVAAVAAVGAWNRFRLVPAMTTAPKRAAARLHRAVVAESAALLGAVAITAILVNVTPAATAAGVGQIFSETVPLGDGSVNVVVDPNRAGENEIHLYVFDEAGRVSGEDFDEVTLRLSLPSAEIGPLERDPFLAGPGHYQLDGNELSIAGRWTIEVVARVNTFDQLTAAVEVPVNP
jgi:copper transport protein